MGTADLETTNNGEWSAHLRGNSTHAREAVLASAYVTPCHCLLLQRAVMHDPPLANE